MRIENAFTVAAPVEQVFGLLTDVEQVAPCMPGASIVGRGEGGEYRGRFRIKVGPVSAAYEGNIAVESSDPERGEIVLRGSGTDPRGAGSANALITAKLNPAEGGTSVVMVTDLDVAGRLAQFSGRSSMMQSVADRMITQFANSLQSRLAGNGNGAGAAAASGAAGGAAAGSSDARAAASGAPAQTSGGAAADDNVFDAGSLMRDVLGSTGTAVLAGLVGLLIGLILGRLGCRGGGR